MRGRRGGVGDVVEVLKRADQRRERVVLGQDPHGGRGDPRHPLIAGVRVGPAGAPQRVAVDRPVPGNVRLVGGAQLAAHRRQGRGVFEIGRLGRQQRPGLVAEPEQGSQLDRLRRGHRQRLLYAVDDDGESPVRAVDDVAVPLTLGRERDPLRQVVGGRRRARRVARAHGQVVLACAGDELPCGGA